MFATTFISNLKNFTQMTHLSVNGYPQQLVMADVGTPPKSAVGPIRVVTNGFVVKLRVFFTVYCVNVLHCTIAGGIRNCFLTVFNTKKCVV